MRRKDRLIENRKEIDTIINGSEVCRLALAKENVPYLVPLSFGYDGNAIFIHTARAGKKIDYFEANSSVCFEFERNLQFVHGGEGPCNSTYSFETVIGYGTISEEVDPKAKDYALSQITHQYTGTQTSFDKQAIDSVRVWKVSITSLEGKKLPGNNVQ